MSRLICAWSSAKARSVELNKIDAENEVRDQPKVLLPTDFFSMKDLFEKKHFKLPAEKIPGTSYVEKKLESLEKGDFKAEKLTEVVNVRQDESNVWTSGGSLKALRTTATIPLPRNTEELRSRLNVLGTAWMFAAAQQTNNPLLDGLTPHCFTEYADYLPGPFAYGLVAKGHDGTHVSEPSWHQVLTYEHEIRTHAYYLMQTEAKPLAIALRAAWDDDIVKKRYFITPIVMDPKEGSIALGQRLAEKTIEMME